MNLSSELISQFVKTTKDTEKGKKETTVYGTVYTNNGTKCVKIDGSELLTPVLSTVEIQQGERVAVLLKNHTATVIGNISSPSVRNEDVNVSLAGYVTNKQLETEKNNINDRIDNLVVAITKEEYDAGTWTAPEGAIIIILDSAE